MRKFYFLLLLTCAMQGLAQNPAGVDSNFNINNLENIHCGMNYGVQRIWGLSDGSAIITNNSQQQNVFNGIIQQRITKLTATGVADTSFNPNGSSFQFAAKIHDVAEDDQGRMYIGGEGITYYNAIQVFGIVRINPDGLLDESFVTGTGFNGMITRIRIQPDGKILVGGAFTLYNGVSRNKIARLNPDGSLDTTFDIGTGFPSGTGVQDIAFNEDGKIVAAGSFTSFNGIPVGRIARLNPDGSLDQTFMTGTGVASTIKSIAVQDDGKVIACGQFTSYNGSTVNRVIRINYDGTLDTGFNVPASITTGPQKISLQPDGRILLLNQNLHRLNADGSVDAGFNSGPPLFDFYSINDGIFVGGQFRSYNNTTVGTVTKLNADGFVDPLYASSPGFDGSVYKIRVQPDQKILVCGNFSTYNNNVAPNFIRLNPDGTIDSGFNIGTGFNLGGTLSCDVQSDGKIIVVGEFSNFNGTSINNVVRLNPDGTIDPSFMAGTLFNGRVGAVVVQPDDKILLGGANGYVRRLNPNGSVDTGFTIATSGQGNEVREIVLRPNGKVIVAKSSAPVYDGTSTQPASVVQYNVNGSVDATFSAPTFNGGANDMALQNDGRLVVVGDFTSVGGSSQKRIVRLNENGTRDTSFSSGTGFDYRASAVEVLPDGKIIVGGYFWYYGTTENYGIVRIQPNGQIDSGFAVGEGFDFQLYSLTIQADGKILAGGSFGKYNQSVAGSFIRLTGNGFYTVSGQNRLDLDQNGCSASDLNFPYLKLNFDDGVNSFYYIANTTGNYQLMIPAGNYSITPLVPSGFSVTPASSMAVFPDQYNTLIQDYCLASIDGNHNDLQVQMVPLGSANPGFNAFYKIIYKNVGVQNISAAVSLEFDGSLMEHVVSNPLPDSQAGNLLSYSFTNLAPQEQRYIYVVFNLNSPTDVPALNMDDVVTFTAGISVQPNEATPEDNIMEFSQIITNSYDPNEIVCLEGRTVGTAALGDYLHYMVRFENNGTSNAQFIKVLQQIDTASLEIGSLEILDSSHNMVTRVNGPLVEFFFDNIFLPFDDANNDGYILYKIKLLTGLEPGHTIGSTASIFFDFNPAIVTNTALTTIENLSTPKFGSNDVVTIYPNPVSSILHLDVKNQILGVAVYNIMGQQVNVPHGHENKAIDVSGLSNGIYVIQIETANARHSARFVKCP